MGSGDKLTKRRGERATASRNPPAKRLVRTASDAVDLHHDRRNNLLKIVAAHAARYPQLQPLAPRGRKIPKAPPNRYPERRSIVAPVLEDVARKSGSDPKELERILFKHGDLEEVVSDLSNRELSARRELERGRVLEAVADLIARHRGLFDDDTIEVHPPHPLSRKVVEEILAETEPRARAARIQMKVAARHRHDRYRQVARDRCGHAILQNAAARAISRSLARARWPFEAPTTSFSPNPLSNSSISTLLVIARDRARSANRELEEIRARRREIGLNRGIESGCQQKARVFMDLAAELVEQMGRSMASRRVGAGSLRQMSQLRWRDVRELLSRAEIGSIRRAACTLVNAAFPRVSKISAVSLKASRAR